VVICTDCIGSCKSNYRTMTTTTTPCKRCIWIFPML
jgi:homoserine acetyltransferase